MPAIDASFLTQRKWQALIGVLVLVGLFFVFRPERDPAEVIRANLYEWAAKLEKSPQAKGGTLADSDVQAITTGTSAALLEDFGYVRRLINSAFTEDAQIRAVRGPREQGRDAIIKWCFALRGNVDTLTLKLSDVTVHFDPAQPMQATASLRVEVDARYSAQRYEQAYHCELELVRDSGDKKWRIAQLVAQNARALAADQASARGSTAD